MAGQEPRVQPPSLDAYADTPLFNTKAVVYETGVPAPTLRAWERRYGILSPRRGVNDYRLYSERDIATVNWLRDRISGGMTISQAIALLRSLEPGKRRTRHFATPPLTHLSMESSGDRFPTETLAQPERFALAELSGTLLRHFASLDEHAAYHTIAQALAIYPVEEVCLSLLTPTLYELGRQWARGEVSVLVEHFASALIRAQLESLLHSAVASAAGPPVLVGCVPGEMHELGALMVALFLRRAGLRVVFLGQNVEMESLLATVSAAQPAGVVLSASLAEHVDALAHIGRRMQALGAAQPVFFFGGQAFAAHPELAEGIPGEYLHMAATEAAHEVQRRITV